MLVRSLLAALGLVALCYGEAGYAEDYTLDAPERAHIRQAIEVGWDAPQTTGGLLEIRPAEGQPTRTSYAYVRDNPQPILAPDTPGEYLIVYVHESEVRASRPLTVFLPDATVDAATTVGAGAQIEVTWTGPDSRQDLIAIASRDGSPIRGASYTYVSNTRGGPAKLQAPADSGEYDVVYVSGSTVLARTPITVGAVTATLRHTARVHAGGELRVTWEGPRNARDMVTFAARDGDPILRSSYAYVSNQQDNVVALRAPEQTGPLDVVYVSSDHVIGRSHVDIIAARIELDGPQEVTALEEFFAAWQGDGNRGDRIDVVDAAGTQLAYSYVRPDRDTTRLLAPPAEGEFHLVYITRDGRELARRPIRVQPAAVPPGTLFVEQEHASLGHDDAVGVIFDASGSMLQRLDGVRRVEIARQTLAELVSESIPAGTGFALRVFGHRETGSCRSDLEIPLAPLDPVAAGKTIQAVNAMNLARTPLGQSIDLAARDLANVEGKRLLIVLTDGEETCDGDPAAAIEALRARGWDITVNIVGFAIDDTALQAEFAAWSELGGGAYFSAMDRASLKAALAEAVIHRFSILGAEGRTIAEGRPGQMIALPAGEYEIERADGQRTPAVVPPGGSTRVTLDP